MASLNTKQSGDGNNGDGHGKGRRRGNTRTDSDTVSGLTLDSEEVAQLEECVGDSVEGLTLDSVTDKDMSPRQRRIQATRNALRTAVGEETRALGRVMRQSEMLLKRISGIKGISSGTVRMAEAAVEAIQDAMEAAASRGIYQGSLDDQLDILMQKEADWREKAERCQREHGTVEERANEGETTETAEVGVQTDPFFFSGVGTTAGKEPGGAGGAMAQQKRKAGSPAEGAGANRQNKRAVGRVARAQGSVPLTPRAETAQAVPGNVFPIHADTEWRVVAGRGRKNKGGQAVAAPGQSAAAPIGTAPKGTQGAQLVTTATRDRPARVKAKPPAVAVKIAKNATYADTLKRIRDGTSITEDMGRITAIRKTRTGDMLIELDRKSSACVDKLKEAVTAKLGNGGTVKALQPRLDVEVRDLDHITTAGELKEAVHNAVGRETPNMSPSDVTVKALAKGFGGRQKAIVSLSDVIARKVVRMGHIMVGWVSCRVRYAASPPARCFRCHRPGHIAAQCSAYADGTVICRRCGEEGHIMTSCANAMRCVACRDKGLLGDATRHLAGSIRCPQTKAVAAVAPE